ncbi:CheF family chemotaxis protein [Halorutilales archaeon Cl-col2-1]
MDSGEKKLADFMGEYVAGSDLGNADLDFDKARILLSNRRLVVAGKDDRTTVPLKSVLDVGKSNLPPSVQDYMSNAISVGYRSKEDGRQRSVIIRGDEERLEKLRDLLYKAILNSAEVYIQHPAKVSGRVMGADWKKSKIIVKRDSIKAKGVTEIDLTTVQDAEISEREIKNSKKTVIGIRHTTDRGIVTTRIYVPDRRHLNILGRYLRKEYQEIVKEVEDISLSESEKRIIVALFSGATEDQLPMVLEEEASEVRRLVNGLIDKEILMESDDGLELTSKGKVFSNRNIEEVNAGAGSSV